MAAKKAAKKAARKPAAPGPPADPAKLSSDGRFSTYEVAPKNDPRDGDLIIQHRGEPRAD